MRVFTGKRVWFYSISMVVFWGERKMDLTKEKIRVINYIPSPSNHPLLPQGVRPRSLGFLI